MSSAQDTESRLPFTSNHQHHPRLLIQTQHTPTVILSQPIQLHFDRAKSAFSPGRIREYRGQSPIYFPFLVCLWVTVLGVGLIWFPVCSRTHRKRGVGLGGCLGAGILFALGEHDWSSNTNPEPSRHTSRPARPGSPNIPDDPHPQKTHPEDYYPAG